MTVTNDKNPAGIERPVTDNKKYIRETEVVEVSNLHMKLCVLESLQDNQNNHRP